MCHAARFSPIHEPVVLVVGSRRTWAGRRDWPEGLPGFLFCDFGDLDRFLGAGSIVEVVLSPLMAQGFDALDVAMQLAGFGFAGRYRAVAEDLPDPGLVRREVRRAAPCVDFDVVMAENVVSLHATRRRLH
jgi:hypothetical protein